MEVVKVGVREDPNDLIIPQVYFKWTEILCEYLKVDCQFIHLYLEVGHFDNNGTAYGFMQALVNGIINTTVPYYVPTEERAKHLHIPSFNFDSEDVFITRKVSFADTQWFTIFRPFRLSVWLVLLMAIVSISGLISMSSQRLRLSQIITDLVNVFAYLTKKGQKITTKRFGGKLMITVWGFSALIIVMMYSSFLMPTLLHKSITVPFSNIRELTACLERGKCRYVSVPSWFMNELEMSDSSSDLCDLRRAIEKQAKVELSWFESFKLTMQSKDVFYVSGPESRLIIDNNHTEYCDRIDIIPSPLSVRTSFLFRKEDQLAKTFESGAKQLDSYGIFEGIRRKYPRHLKCQNLDTKVTKTTKVTAHPLPLQAMAGCFVAILFGGILGFLGLLLELLMAKCNGITSGCDNDATSSCIKQKKQKCSKPKVSIRPSLRVKSNFWTMKLQKRYKNVRSKD